MDDANKNDDDNLGSFYMGRRKSSEPGRRLPPGVLTVFVLLAFAGIVWYAYPRGAEKYTDMDIPVVKADTAPVKEQPKDPGGMEVPHQDSTVFDPLAGKAPDAVEKILPSPEEPVDKAQAIKATEDVKPPVAAPAVPAAKPSPHPQVKAKAADISPVQTLPPPLTEEQKAFVAAVPQKAVKKAPPKAVKKAAPAKEDGKRYIQLGSYRDVAGAKKDWARLKKKYSAFLGKLSMKTAKVDLPGKGVYYRLQAGKVTEARAREICKDLKKSNSGGCILVKQ